MMHYLKYLRYLLIHIWYVRQACWAHGLFWQGLIHDLSKFRPSEFIPYAQHFYRDNTEEGLNAIGEFGLAELAPYGFYAKDRFNYAWLHHQKRNKHHWQYWVLSEDSGDVFPLPMPHKYRLEMLCDWWGASMATGNGGRSRTWYEKNKGKINLHWETRQWVEANVSDDFLGYGKKLALGI